MTRNTRLKPSNYRIPLISFFLMLSSALSLPAAAENSMEDACKALIMDYAIHRDHKNVDDYAALFTDDAKLSVLGDVRIGRAAIRERLAQASGTTVHLMSTIRITRKSADTASGISYATIYTAPPGDGPHAVPGFAGIGEYHDTFQLTADGWRISERVLVMKLTGPGFTPPPARSN